MDHHVPRAITIGLRLRGIDVITAFEDDAGEMTDSELLDRAGEIGRVLFTQDDDLLRFFEPSTLLPPTSNLHRPKAPLVPLHR